MRRIALLGFAVAVSTAALAAPASASHAWSNYHWARTANPFTIAVGDNVDASWEGSLATAASDWSSDTAGNPLNAVVVPGGTTGSSCEPTSGRVEVCNAGYGDTGWLGIAEISVSADGHIVQGTARMNDSYLATYPEVARQQVMCQEVGHDWGLDHQDTSGADRNTCMDYADALDNPQPNQHDYEQLATIYSHVDSSTAAGSVVSEMSARESASPERVRRHEGPGHATVVERYADGSKRIMYITYA